MANKVITIALLAVVSALTAVDALAQGPGTAQGIKPLEKKKDGVYRFQPGLRESTLELVPPEEIRLGLAYNYYHPQLARHVWGFAQQDGTFKYAFGEGTIVPTNRLDLRLSPTLRSQLLERGMPGLEKKLEITGGSPAVKLVDGDWTLMPSKSSLRVFDLATGHRWEWHGTRRKAVLHTFGDQWQVVNGRYIPATGPVFMVGGGCCSSVRAGSAVLVMRTPE